MFRFTIRDVLWLTLVIGLAIGWWLSARHWNSRNHLLTEKNEQLQQEVSLANKQAKRANDQSDKAWAAANDPFYRPNPVDALFRRRTKEIAP